MPGSTVSCRAIRLHRRSENLSICMFQCVDDGFPFLPLQFVTREERGTGRCRALADSAPLSPVPSTDGILLSTAFIKSSRSSWYRC